MQYLAPRQTVAISAILAFVAGCDLPFADRATEVVVIEAPDESHVRYVPCSVSEASTILTFAVDTPATGVHEEIFPLRPTLVSDTRYPSHPGGFVSACGPPATGNQLPFNRSCYIESATENAIGIRFRMTCGAGAEPAPDLDELIWLTIDRGARIKLPHGATATAVFETHDPQ
jgi:hypothetical protein